MSHQLAFNLRWPLHILKQKCQRKVRGGNIEMVLSPGSVTPCSRVAFDPQRWFSDSYLLQKIMSPPPPPRLCIQAQSYINSSPIGTVSWFCLHPEGSRFVMFTTWWLTVNNTQLQENTHLIHIHKSRETIVDEWVYKPVRTPVGLQTSVTFMKSVLINWNRNSPEFESGRKGSRYLFSERKQQQDSI